MLGETLRGHWRSDGMRGNVPRRENVRREAEQAWRDWWSRRSSPRVIDGEQGQQLLALSKWPIPQIVHNI